MPRYAQIQNNQREDTGKLWDAARRDCRHDWSALYLK